MDKLKENLYGVSLGLTIVVLLVLAYMLVIQPVILDNLGAATLNKIDRDLKDLDKKDFLPNQRRAEYLEEKKTQFVVAVENGEKNFAQQAEKFNTFFSGSTTPPEMAFFASTYRDRIGALEGAYLEKFGSRSDEEDDDRKGDDLNEFKIVAFFEVAEAGHVPIAMKEFRIAEAVFNTCTDLELGGLRRIDFPGRLRRKSESDTEVLDYMECVVEMDMHFHQIENFLTALCKSETVPLLIKQVEAKKTLQQLKPFTNFKRTKKYANSTLAQEEYSAVVKEPMVAVDITLQALLWKGFAEEEEENKPK